MEHSSLIGETRSTVNRYDSRFPSPADRGFVAYQKINQQVWMSPVTLDANGNDVYGPNSQASDHARQSAVAPRAFGLARYAYVDYSVDTDVIHTGDLVFDAAAETDRGYPHLEAERSRKDNVFLVHSEDPNNSPVDELDLYQLQP